MKPLPFNEIPDFEPAEISVFKHIFISGLFTNLWVDRKTLPEGCFAYDIRESDSGYNTFCTVEHFFMVNHTGTIITREEIPMRKGDYSKIKEFGIEDRELSDDDWRNQYLKD